MIAHTLFTLIAATGPAEATPIIVWTPELSPTIRLTFEDATSASVSQIDITWTPCDTSVMESTTTLFSVDLVAGAATAAPFDACAAELDFGEYVEVSGTQGGEAFVIGLEDQTYSVTTSSPAMTVSYNTISGSPSGQVTLSLD